MWTGIETLIVMQNLRESLPQFLADFFNFMSSPVFYLVLPVIIGFSLFLVINKRGGEFVCMNVIFAYNIVNFAKLIIKQPRPWILNPEIHPPVESAHAPGYSLPSGHTAIATSGYISAVLILKNWWVRIILIVITALIIFARIFLCVHTPLDVITGILFAVAIIVANWYLLKESYKSEKKYYTIGIIYVAIALAVSIAVMILDDDITTNDYMGLGFFIGFCVGRIVEHRYVQYEIPDVSVGRKILICILGCAVVFALIFLSFTFGGVFGLFASFISMIWFTAIYPYIVKKKLSMQKCKAV